MKKQNQEDESYEHLLARKSAEIQAQEYYFNKYNITHQITNLNEKLFIFNCYCWGLTIFNFILAISLILLK